MTAQAELKAALREAFGPVARRHGYRGTAPTWRRSSSTDDWAIVNVQSSSGSTAEDVRCVINIAVAPEPWLRWRRHQLGARAPKQVTESLGMFRDRVHPTGTQEDIDGWWSVGDAQSARQVVQDMVRQMNEAAWATLDSLLTRVGMLQRIESGDLGFAKRQHFEVHFARAEALLLMDEGPSDALEACLARAMEYSIDGAARASAEEFDAWVRGSLHPGRSAQDA